MSMTSQLNSLSNMVKTMNAQNVCDAKCQERRRIEELRKTYVKAKQNAQNAQPNLDRAEKDYVTAARGAAFYSKLQGAKFKKQAQKQVKDWNDYIEPKWKDIENKILYYKGLYPYQDNVKLVYNNY